MGCDIHWIIERQSTDGAWHAVASSRYAFSSREDTSFDGFLAFRETPAGQLNDRNYALFGQLSCVRTNTYGTPAMTEGLPEDASPEARLRHEDGDYHSWGWRPGRTLLEWKDGRRKLLRAFAAKVVAVLARGEADTILPAYGPGRDGYPEYADIDGTETGHERLDRLERSRHLVDWRTNPDSWRIIVFYDS